MTFYELIEELEPAYDPDSPRQLTDYVNASDGSLVEPPPDGDALALFIVRELYAVWCGSGSDWDRFADAKRAMATAGSELAIMSGKIRLLSLNTGPSP